MKKTALFAGFMGVLLAGVMNANADFSYYLAPDSDASNYPTWSTASGTTTGDDFLKLATTKYVDKKVDDENDAVVTLNNNANTQNTVVSGNETSISDLETNRQVVPQNASNSFCNEHASEIGENKKYSACGYISNTTTASNSTGSGDNVQVNNASANYEWIVIAAKGLADEQIGGSGSNEPQEAL